jgi:hypothetical protein
MMDDAVIEIAPCLLEQPIAQTSRRMLDMTADAELGESRLRLAALNDTARFTFPREYESMNLTAQRQQRTFVKRNGMGHAIKTLAHPIDIADDEGVGFVEVALHGKRYDYGAPCATDAKRQTTRTGVPANLDRSTDLIELSWFRQGFRGRYGLPHRSLALNK